MRALFDEDTSDISLIITPEEVRELKSTKETVPILDAKACGIDFWLMNSGKKYMQVLTPPNPNCSQKRTVKISNDAYSDLLNNGRCGDRYEGSSKVSVIIEGQQ